MERTSCPHCGALWFIEELNYSIVQKMGGYKTDGATIVIETSGKKLKSSFTNRCLACGYSINLDIMHP